MAIWKLKILIHLSLLLEIQTPFLIVGSISDASPAVDQIQKYSTGGIPTVPDEFTPDQIRCQGRRRHLKGSSSSGSSGSSGGGSRGSSGSSGGGSRGGSSGTGSRGSSGNRGASGGRPTTGGGMGFPGGGFGGGGVGGRTPTTGGRSFSAGCSIKDGGLSALFGLAVAAACLAFSN